MEEKSMEEKNERERQRGGNKQGGGTPIEKCQVPSAAVDANDQ